MNIRHQLSLLRRTLAYRFITTFSLGLRCRAGTDGPKTAPVIRLYPQSRLECQRCWPLFKGTYNEKAFLNAFLGACTEGSVVYDIGAHIGVFCLFAGKVVGASGKVFAFEMDSQNHNSLCLNVRRNKMACIKVIKKAVSSACGTLRYRRTTEESGDGAASVCVNDQATHEAEMVCIDHLVARREIDAPDVVKIDVEGHELAVIKGMRETLRANSVKIFVEVHASLLQECGSSYDELNAALEDLDYHKAKDMTLPLRAEMHLMYCKNAT